MRSIKSKDPYWCDSILYCILNYPYIVRIISTY